ncbi:MAG: hypothetical protein QXQ71_03205 [Desulfurococcaceae archaeon]
MTKQLQLKSPQRRIWNKRILKATLNATGVWLAGEPTGRCLRVYWFV